VLLNRHGKLIGARVPATIALVSMRVGSCWVLRDLSDDWSEPNIWNLSGKSPGLVAATIVRKLIRTVFEQDFYTSSESNILDGPGRYAMASLIGTIGGGLTWSGSVFVAMLISKGCNMNLMCLSGSALMSLGFILASLATKVCASIIAVSAFD